MNLNPAHWHLLVNHLPVMGILFVTLLLAYGYLKKSNAIVIAVHWFNVLLGILTIITSQTGEKAAHFMHDAGLADRNLIGQHAHMADYAQWLILIIAALSLITLLVKRLQYYHAIPIVILILSIVDTGLMSWTSLLGGEIMHKEIRAGFTVKTGDSTETEKR